VSDVKTRTYSESELLLLDHWRRSVVTAIDLRKPTVPSSEYERDGYCKHLTGPDTWRLRKAIEQALGTTRGLPTKLEAFARCAILKTAQWALDGRRTLPTISDFRTTLFEYCGEMIAGAREFTTTVLRNALGDVSEALCVNHSSVGLERIPEIVRLGPPRLVLTSPPYPGIHVLYHRWQVDGRKETAAPFWIADRRDGSGSSYYTMGDRKAYELASYFNNLRATLGSITAVCDSRTIVVQVVAFSEPRWQLPRYLSVADDVGLREYRLPRHGSKDGRLWRSVPNRKWHANQKGSTGGALEVVFFHRLR
jgi:hypothetical protein